MDNGHLEECIAAGVERQRETRNCWVECPELEYEIVTDREIEATRIKKQKAATNSIKVNSSGWIPIQQKSEFSNPQDFSDKNICPQYRYQTQQWTTNVTVKMEELVLDYQDVDAKRDTLAGVAKRPCVDLNARMVDFA